MTEKLMTEEELSELKKVITEVEQSIHDSKITGDQENEASWNYQSGILLSRHDAELLLKALTESRNGMFTELPNKTKIANEFYDGQIKTTVAGDERAYVTAESIVKMLSNYEDEILRLNGFGVSKRMFTKENLWEWYKLGRNPKNANEEVACYADFKKLLTERKGRG